MQTATQTTPRTKATDKTFNTLNQVKTPAINQPVQLDSTKENNLSRLLASCCDCV